MNFPFLKEATKHIFSKPSTEKQFKEAPENYRGKIIFHPDRCINCGLCMRVCAPDAITRTIEKGEDGDQVTMEFHMGSCTFCQTCVDFCNKNAIEMSRDYSMVVQDENDLKVTGTFFKKKPAPRPAPAKDGAAAPAAKKAEATAEKASAAGPEAQAANGAPDAASAKPAPGAAPAKTDEKTEPPAE